MAEGLHLRIGLVGTAPEKLKRVASRVLAALVGGVRDLLHDVQRIATREAPIRHGHLRRTIGPPRVSTSGNNVQGELAASALYARFVEEGTRPHEIRPRNAQALRFMGERLGGGRGRGAGDFVFARAVQHPGTAPRPFMKPALEQVRQGPPSAKERLRALIIQTMTES